MNPQRLAELHRKLAELHAEIAAELAGEATPAANDGGSPLRPKPAKPAHRRGPRVPSAAKLEALGISDTDRAAADQVAKQRGLTRPGG